MSSRRRPLAMAAVLVALVAGAAVAATLGGEDEPGRPATSATGAGATEAGSEQGDAGSGTSTSETRSGTVPTTPGAPSGGTASPRDEQAIERAIEDAVAAAEEGRPPPGSEPWDLPGSDELSIDSVRAEGDRGSATLSSGAVVELTRSGGRWRIVAVRAP
jgi:hypothetical protein